MQGQTQTGAWSWASIVTKRQKSTIVSGMVVGAVVEAMKGAVVVAEAVVVVGVVAGLEIMKVAGSREPAVTKYYD